MFSSLALTVQFAAVSFVFRRLDVFEDFFSPSDRVCAGVAGTSPPSVIPLEPSAGLDGFEEEYRLWCERYESACVATARGPVRVTEATIVDG